MFVPYSSLNILNRSLFRSKETGSISADEDRADQPSERVLPKMFGKWDPDTGNRANCLGKAIMLAGFGKLCGVDMMSVTPMLTLNANAHRYFGLAAEGIYKFLEEKQIAFSETRRLSLLALSQYWQNQGRAEFVFPHTSVGFRMRDKNFMVIN